MEEGRARELCRTYEAECLLPLLPQMPGEEVGGEAATAAEEDARSESSATSSLPSSASSVSNEVPPSTVSSKSTDFVAPATGLVQQHQQVQQAVRRVVACWRRLYGATVPRSSLAAGEMPSVKARRAESIVGAANACLADLTADLKAHASLRCDWFVARHVLGVALILRMSERFMEHLESAYLGQGAATPAAEAENQENVVTGTPPPASEFVPTVRNHAAYVRFSACQTFAEDSAPLDYNRLYDNDVRAFFQHRCHLVRALRERPYPPFTVVRLCELLDPQDKTWASNFWKWIYAVQRNVTDASTSYHTKPAAEPPYPPERADQVLLSYSADTPADPSAYIFISEAPES